MFIIETSGQTPSLCEDLSY